MRTFKYKKPPSSAELTVKIKLPARDKIMHFLGARDHSEKELIRKLKEREYTIEEIQFAIEQVTKEGWLKPPEQLAEQVASSLSRKKKGISYINNYLRERGLPPVKPDPDNELRKAVEITRQIYKNNDTLDKSSRDKLARRLASRGFSMEIILKTLRFISEKKGLK